MKYKDYQRNHVIVPGREKALHDFLKADYKGIQHKWKNGFNSNSEDALTWSCFDTIANLPLCKKLTALEEIFEDAFEGRSPLSFKDHHQADKIEIHVGKQYTGHTTNESTEVDASIEAPDLLVFVEAKLYSTMSMASPPEKPHDQIARKIRIGLDNPLGDKRDFYFIFLDVAPLEKLKRGSKIELLESRKSGYHEKWKSAWLFNYYKKGANNSLRPLRDALTGIETPPVESVADNMGWLTWSDLFKATLRGAISK